MTTNDNITPKWGGVIGSFGRVFAELKANRRATGGLLAIAFLVGAYGLLGVNDAVVAMRGTYDQESLRLQRMIAAGAEKDWPARAQASSVMRGVLEGRLWKAESEGVALANVQDWVTTAGRDAGLDRLQVKIEIAKPKGVAPDLRQLTATITARETEASLESFLDRIQRDQHLLVVDRLHVQDKPVPLLEMTLLAYAKLVPSAKAALNE
jgi:hypothetical protein